MNPTCSKNPPTPRPADGNTSGAKAIAGPNPNEMETSPSATSIRQRGCPVHAESFKRPSGARFNLSKFSVWLYSCGSLPLRGGATTSSPLCRRPKRVLQLVPPIGASVQWFRSWNPRPKDLDTNTNGHAIQVRIERMTSCMLNAKSASNTWASCGSDVDLTCWNP